MHRYAVTPLENLAGVAAVVVLSVVLHAGLMTGSSLVAPRADASLSEIRPDHVIAAPDSAVWGQAVLRLNGMN
jgi:hypothetical protein